MNVAALIDALRAYPGNYQVIISYDAEGKSYSPLAALIKARYQARTRYDGDLDQDRSTPHNAIVLYPTR